MRCTRKLRKWRKMGKNNGWLVSKNWHLVNLSWTLTRTYVTPWWTNILLSTRHLIRSWLARTAMSHDAVNSVALDLSQLVKSNFDWAAWPTVSIIHLFFCGCFHILLHFFHLASLCFPYLEMSTVPQHCPTSSLTVISIPHFFLWNVLSMLFYNIHSPHFEWFFSKLLPDNPIKNTFKFAGHEIPGLGQDISLSVYLLTKLKLFIPESPLYSPPQSSICSSFQHACGQGHKSHKGQSHILWKLCRQHASCPGIGFQWVFYDDSVQNVKISPIETQIEPM